MSPQAKCLARYLACFEQLNPQRLDDLAELFHEKALFKDPFNHVVGRAGIQQVFAHMYQQLNDPKFEVIASALVGDQALLHWRLRFKTRKNGREAAIEGMSRVLFDNTGQVLEHIDYWDAAEQIYSKLPVIGFLLGRIRGYFSAGTRGDGTYT